VSDVTTAGDRLRIPADLGRVAELRHFVRDAAAAASAPVECLEDLVQAVDEAATNAIIHGYRGAEGWIEVSAAVNGDEFIVALEDAAPAFDPTAAPEPDLTVPPMARKPGGMGVHLIRASTDRMTYRPRPGGGNILTLVRSMRPSSTKEG
jgi:serine/threonine-protein kinase RsbW